MMASTSTSKSVGDKLGSGDDGQEQLTPEEENEPETTAVLTDPNQPPPNWAMISAASYAIIMLLIGLPLWWQTTTVERVPLPYQEMLELHDQFQESNFVIPLHVLLKGFNEAETTKGDNSWQYFRKSLTNEETKLLESSQSLAEIDQTLCKRLSVADSSMHLIVYNIQQPKIFTAYGEQIVLGNCKYVYFVSNSTSVDHNKLDLVLAKLVDYTRTEEVLPLAINYNILFTLIVPEPEFFDARWEIGRGVADYVQPMLDKLSSLSSFVTRGQTIFYHKLNLKPTLSNGVFQIPYEQLPLVINPVESKLTSFVSENPVLNFLIYVSPCDVSPLQIMDESSANLNTNSFYVPQWGGIQLYNSQCDKEKKPVLHDIQMPQVMSIIISQFRDLIGVPIVDDNIAKLLEFHGSALRSWEVDFIIRKRLQNLLDTASNTLQSLGNLLGQITNIVVKEEVGQQVQLSVDSLKIAYDEARAGNVTTAQSYEQSGLHFIRTSLSSSQ